jgi:hypothetical protein
VPHSSELSMSPTTEGACAAGPSRQKSRRGGGASMLPAAAGFSDDRSQIRASSVSVRPARPPLYLRECPTGRLELLNDDELEQMPSAVQGRAALHGVRPIDEPNVV